ncbi:electron transfer complex subunit TmcD [Maridesulfovibrio frigidus]|uniref:electron transfer complex subunit TmcD n=1 Tax=Maridesulfovibrio frigidus TaxID=340956 RepID=UPI0004E173BE|nr:hypothetical protein [Maridesulfovibrio frigidus]
MPNASTWDWNPGRREVQDVSSWSSKFEWVEEFHASSDGEKVGAVVKTGDMEFTACVNGKVWDERYDRVFYLKFSPDSRLTGIVQQEGEWTLSVDGTHWPEMYGYIWGTTFGPDGSIVCAVQQDTEYGMGIDGVLWENFFANANNFALGDDGKSTAAVVQVAPLAQADIETFQKGIYSVAVNGKAWDKVFMNCYTPVFDPKCEKVACQIRKTLYDYTIAIDGKIWQREFQCVWDPCFNPASGAVAAPVRLGGKWGMAQDGEVIWPTKFAQCWHQQFSADGSKLWAIVAPKFGSFTVAVDGTPWSITSPVVIDLAVSPDGNRGAALGKDGTAYSVLCDGKVWPTSYEMAWKPVFSADSTKVAAKVEKNGRFTVVLDGKPYGQDFDQCWEPAFSPCSTKVLIRAIDGGKFVRIVADVSEF